MNYAKEIDFSSLECYIQCPRKFLFQYIMHFRSHKPSIDLTFGSCWHYGLEKVYKEILAKTKLTIVEATELSVKSFNALWTIEGKQHFDEDQVYPKSPGHAANMYYDYWSQYLSTDTKDRKIIAVESPFTIDLSIIEPGLPSYIGRLDLAAELPDGSLEIIDHKTCKALYPITLPGFEMSYQTDGYLTAGHMFYDKIPMMVFSMAICQKSKIAFHRYQIMKRKSALDQFLNDLTYYCKEILKHINIMTYELEQPMERNTHVKCFPRRPGYACTTYFRECPYAQLCKLRNNPLLWHDKPPQGYQVNEWHPATHEQQIKEQLK